MRDSIEITGAAKADSPPLFQAHVTAPAFALPDAFQMS
jgi:hypothetical protein